jgi:hypothetical protein
MKMTYKQHNDELHDLRYSINTTRLKLVGRVARVGEKKNTYRVLVGKPEGRDSIE